MSTTGSPLAGSAFQAISNEYEWVIRPPTSPFIVFPLTSRHVISRTVIISNPDRNYFFNIARCEMLRNIGLLCPHFVRKGIYPGHVGGSPINRPLGLQDGLAVYGVP